jgi:tripartite-type tricarboxylate transporter receptor subunit TctC
VYHNPEDRFKLGGVDMRTKIFAVLIFILIGTNIGETADYPTKPVTIICPSAPGGSHDIQGRIFATYAEKLLGKPMVFVNKAGAAWMLGTLAVLQASPDGYTIGMEARSIGNTIEWEIANGRKPSVTRKDMVALGAFTSAPALFLVPYNSPWKSLEDVARDLKAKPKHYAYCSGGLYGSSHLPAEYFLREKGITARHVPQKSGGECLSALVGGHFDFATQFPPGSMPLVQAKNLRILASHSEKRYKFLPEVPTMKELVGLFAHRKTPQAIVMKLRDTIKKVTEDKSFIDIMEKQGTEVLFISGEELEKFWEKDSETLSRLYKQLIQEKK